MKTFLFKSQRTLEQPLTEVFEFFSNAQPRSDYTIIAKFRNINPRTD